MQPANQPACPQTAVGIYRHVRAAFLVKDLRLDIRIDACVATILMFLLRLFIYGDFETA